MSRAQFLKGAKALIDGREHVLHRQVSSGVWQLEASDTGEFRKETHEQLLERYLAGTFQFVADNRDTGGGGKRQCSDAAIRQFELLPSELQNRAKARRHYVTTILAEVGPTPTVELIEAAARKVWEKLHWPKKPPHRVTIWRWMKRYVPEGQDVRALVDRHHRCGNRKARLPDRLVEIMQEAIDVKFMALERATVTDTLDHAKAEVARENRLRLESEQLPLPRFRQIKRMILRIPAFDRYAARHGRLSAERHFRSVMKQTIASFPLERVEIDHTRMDVFAVDEETMLPLGRPWLTLCIDVLTRAILGFDLSFDPPSYMTVSRCLKMAILPKGNLSARFPSVKNTWDMYGIMETLVVDNGLEFHSKNLEAACLTLGISIQYCPRKQPWFKGAVERVLGTLNRGVAHGVPGTTFSNILEKEDYEAAKKATITLKTLREMIYVWIVDYYHQRPHKGLGDIPAHAWRTEALGMSLPVPANPQELEAMLGRIESRRLTHKGIELNGLFYNSEEAGALMRSRGTDLEVTVRYQDGDLGTIHILVPDSNVYIPVQAVAFSYADGLTLWQHRVCKRFAKQKLKGRTDVVALAEAKRKISELVEGDLGRKRSRRHQSFTPLPSAAVAAPAAASPPASTKQEAPKAPPPPPEIPPPFVERPVAPRCYSAVKVDRRPVAL